MVCRNPKYEYCVIGQLCNTFGFKPTVINRWKLIDKVYVKYDKFKDEEDEEVELNFSDQFKILGCDSYSPAWVPYITQV